MISKKTSICTFCNKEFITAEGQRFRETKTQKARNICPECVKLPKSKLKVKNSYPKQKLVAARRVIEWDLRTYQAMKDDIREMIQDIDDEAAPKATDITSNIYSKSKDIHPQGGFNTSVVIGHSIHCQTSDPALFKAESLKKYREKLFAGTEYKEMIRRINAIERVLSWLEKSSNTDDNLRARMIRLKYFLQEDSDEKIAQTLNISIRTFYYWKNKTIKEIAKQIGFVV